MVGYGEFHWRDGWTFARNDDGSVTFRNENFVDDRLPDSQPGRFVLLTIPPNEWASIVASVSKGGETSESYSGTLAFHMGAVSLPSTKPSATYCTPDGPDYCTAHDGPPQRCSTCPISSTSQKAARE